MYKVIADNHFSQYNWRLMAYFNNDKKYFHGHASSTGVVYKILLEVYIRRLEMSKKRTISLQDHIASIADRKSRLMFGGNFSGYLQYLICSDNADEVKKVIEDAENKKPRKISDVRKAEFTNKCPYCGEEIKVGDDICNSIFPDNHEQFVHLRCSKE